MDFNHFLMYFSTGLLLIVIGIITLKILLNRKKKLNVKNSIKVLVVLGSGGHSSEMLKILSTIKPKYNPRIYVAAAGDKISIEKVSKLERLHDDNAAFSIEVIPRSRQVHQSWLSTVITTIIAFLYSVPLMYKHKPDLILCNGPGTCIPICIISYLMKICFIKNSKIVYVESICRVHSMSLSGKILYCLADTFFVQWPSLQERYPKSRYIGRIS